MSHALAMGRTPSFSSKNKRATSLSFLMGNFLPFFFIYALQVFLGAFITSDKEENHQRENPFFTEHLIR
jgi:hypothetical protein